MKYAALFRNQNDFYPYKIVKTEDISKVKKPESHLMEILDKDDFAFYVDISTQKDIKVVGVDTSCLREGEQEFARNLFETKQKSLEEELAREKDFFNKFGLYSTRDTEEIEDDLKKVKTIVSNIDSLPRCK